MSTKEHKVLRANYAEFCSILKTELELLPKFVQENIISADQSQDIPLLPTAQRGQAILANIVGPVESSLTKGYYTTIKILKQYGKKDSQAFARKMEKELGISDDTLAQTGSCIL